MYIIKSSVRETPEIIPRGNSALPVANTYVPDLFQVCTDTMGRYTGKKCRLLTMLWLTALFFLVEIVVGYVTNSMALIADSFHMLSDVAALVVAFLSVKVSSSTVILNFVGRFHCQNFTCITLLIGYKQFFVLQMSPKKWSKNTFGWARAEVLGALVNAVFLVALCFSITVEACKRFIEVEEIHEARLLVAVGALGLVVNVIGLCLFHGEYRIQIKFYLFSIKFKLFEVHKYNTYFDADTCSCFKSSLKLSYLIEVNICTSILGRTYRIPVQKFP